MANNWYVDLINGDDLNDGLGWGTAVKTLTNLNTLGVGADDVIKIAKNATQQSTGFTCNSSIDNVYVTLEQTVDLLFLMRQCDESKGFSANGATFKLSNNASPIDNINGANIFWGTVPSTNTKYFYYQFDSALNLQNYQKIQFNIHLNESALDSWTDDSLKFVLCSDSSGDFIVEDLLTRLYGKSSNSFSVVLDNLSALPLSVLSFAIYTTNSTTLNAQSAITISSVQAVSNSINTIQYGDYLKINDINSYFKVKFIDNVDTNSPIVYFSTDVKRNFTSSTIDLIRPTEKIIKFSDFPLTENDYLPSTQLTIGGSSVLLRTTFSFGWNTSTDTRDGFVCLESNYSCGLLNIDNSINHFDIENLLISDTTSHLLEGSSLSNLDIFITNCILINTEFGNKDNSNINKLFIENSFFSDFGGFNVDGIVDWDIYNSFFFNLNQPFDNILASGNISFLDNSKIYNSFISIYTKDFELRLIGINLDYCDVIISPSYGENDIININSCFFTDSSLQIYTNGILETIEFKEEERKIIFEFQPDATLINKSGQNKANAITLNGLQKTFFVLIKNTQISNSNFIFDSALTPSLFVNNCQVIDCNFQQINTQNNDNTLLVCSGNGSVNQFTNCNFLRTQYKHYGIGCISKLYSCSLIDNPPSIKNINAESGHLMILSNCDLNTGFDSAVHYQSPESKLIFHKYNQIQGDHRIYFHKGQAITNNIMLHTPGGKSWEINTTANLIEDEVILEIGLFAVKENLPFSISLFVYVSHANSKLILKAQKQQFSTAQNELRAESSIIGSWEQLNLSFTPDQNGVISFYITMETDNDNKTFFYDDLSVSQS